MNIQPKYISEGSNKEVTLAQVRVQVCRTTMLGIGGLPGTLYSGVAPVR